jgi:hypothetical protein
MGSGPSSLPSPSSSTASPTSSTTTGPRPPASSACATERGRRSPRCVASWTTSAPPPSTELGWAGALRQHAAAFADAGLPIHVDAPDELPAMSAAVEVAAFDALCVGRRRPRAPARVDLGLADPLAQRLGPDAELLGHPRHHAEALAAAASIDSSTIRTARWRSSSGYFWAGLRRPCICHAPSSLPRDGASKKPRPVHGGSAVMD